MGYLVGKKCTDVSNHTANTSQNMAQKHRYLIYTGLFILLVTTISELVILRSVLIHHQKLDAQSALGFIESRILGYYETTRILSGVTNVPPYLKKLSWLLDELQGQPFLVGVLILENNKVLLNSFPKNQFPSTEVFSICREGKVVNDVLYMCKNIEPEPNHNLFLLVGLETKFTRLLWHKGLLYGALVFLCAGITLLLYSLYVDRLIRNQAELEKKLLASEGLATIGKLAAMLSHEIRNPLNAITMGLHFMSELGKIEPKMLEKLKKETNKLTELTTELLSLSRGFKITPVSFRLGDLLMELEYKFLDLAREKQAKFKVLGQQNLLIVGDKRWLSRALENLLRNSFEALYRGGSVTLEVQEIASNIQFQVIDSGRGIHPHNIPRVFKPFYTTKNGGFGLGLYIVKKVAEAHGGKTWIKKDKKGRTVFILSLPIRGKPHG